MKRWNWTCRISWVRLAGGEMGELFGESCDPFTFYSRLGTAFLAWRLLTALLLNRPPLTASSVSVWAGACELPLAGSLRAASGFWFGSPGALLSWADLRSLKCGGSVWDREVLWQFLPLLSWGNWANPLVSPWMVRGILLKWLCTYVCDALRYNNFTNMSQQVIFTF